MGDKCKCGELEFPPHFQFREQGEQKMVHNLIRDAGMCSPSSGTERSLGSSKEDPVHSHEKNRMEM